ncbi:VTT domain-containing protein [Microbacterium sp. zg-Y818]|uniref:DedA family protein n=1 Tax=unclassified Microbacterium TaxID=2609290 RepID=UPI00214ABD67|nr:MULTISPECIES: VTT domain-containing protein [unclassified Microbacterium]MCR2800724.1 VTT domain-containing protein [Microbacterium sp. zg.Y818]WIM23448.1 VTT domain-containing protein [Microbacterium sp. zg-Y818]
MEIINELILQAVASPWLYPVMFAVAALDGFFPPVPSETLLVAAAAVAASAGGPDVVLLCAAAAAGAVVGDNLAYLLGRTVGTRRWRWLQRPRVAAAFAWARGTLERRGALLIIGARYIPIGRVAVNMSAGAVRYPWRRFLPLSIVAAVSWTLYSAGIGLVAGHWLADQPLLSAIAGVLVALLIGLVVDRVAARRRAGAVTPDMDAQEERGKVSLS